MTWLDRVTYADLLWAIDTLAQVLEDHADERAWQQDNGRAEWYRDYA